MNRNEYERVEASNPFNDAPVYRIESTGSTMSDGEQLISGRGLPGMLPFEAVRSGTVLWADYQRKGIGRMPGRIWEGEWGESCLFSLVLHEREVPGTAGFFPLLAGMALRQLIKKDYAVEGSVKWPNDVLYLSEGTYKKAAGILCRKKGEWYLLGMGINCNQISFDGALKDRAVSIRMLTGKKIDTGEMLFSMLDTLKWIWKSADAVFWKEELERHLLFKNEEVTLLKGQEPKTEELRCTVLGIGDEGELLVRPAEGGDVTRIYAGEISPS